MDLSQLSDVAIVTLYEYWSEMNYSASFLIPNEETVAQFRRWFQALLVGWEMTHEGSRLALIAEFRRQEARDDTPED